MNNQSNQNNRNSIGSGIETKATVVIIISRDESLRTMLATLLASYGYKTQCYEDTIQAGESVKQGEKPQAIIMDAVFPAAGNELTELGDILEHCTPVPPVIFLADSGDMEARLQAIRFGGRAFFRKPVNSGDLIIALDTMTGRRPQDSYRFLCVPGNKYDAERICSLLRECGLGDCGLKGHIVSTPQTILQDIEMYLPEVILMDEDFTFCSAIELTGVVRQHEKFHGIPIVYLGSSDDEKYRHEALLKGGDDYLFEPINVETMRASLLLRAERAGILRDLSEMDAATGLYKHSILMDRLQREMAATRNNHSTLSYAMIDIDHFRQVNEAHGTGVGNEIIKNLAIFLKRRLPAHCLAGRYGGEEFGIVFPNMEAVSAREILNRIRADFANIRHPSRSSDFSVTFSGGISSSPPLIDSSSMARVADEALYRAKREGRNQICLHQV